MAKTIDLKILQGGEVICAGIVSKDIKLGGDPIDITSDDDNGFRRLMTRGGPRFVDVDFEGVIKDNVLRKCAFGSQHFLNGVQLLYPDGSSFHGNFFLAGYTEKGETNNAIKFTCELQLVAGPGTGTSGGGGGGSGGSGGGTGDPEDDDGYSGGNGSDDIPPGEEDGGGFGDGGSSGGGGGEDHPSQDFTVWHEIGEYAWEGWPFGPSEFSSAWFCAAGDALIPPASSSHVIPDYYRTFTGVGFGFVQSYSSGELKFLLALSGASGAENLRVTASFLSDPLDTAATSHGVSQYGDDTFWAWSLGTGIAPAAFRDAWSSGSAVTIHISDLDA